MMDKALFFVEIFRIGQTNTPAILELSPHVGFANVGFYKNRKSIHMWWAFRDFFNILWDFLFSNPTIAHKFVGFFRFCVFLWDISKIFCFSDHKRGGPTPKNRNSLVVFQNKSHKICGGMWAFFDFRCGRGHILSYGHMWAQL